MPPRYVIIGTGIAGISAAEEIRARDASANIVLCSDDPHGFYSRPGLAYLLSGAIPEKQLTARSSADWHALRLEWHKTRVSQIIPAEHQVIFTDHKILGYDRLLLATGATAIPPEFPGGSLKGIFKLDHLDDARAILRHAQRNQPAVVVGGGITALEIVEGLLARGMKVHYLLRGERYWANVLDETESRVVEERLAEEGVVIHRRTQVKQALGKTGMVTSIETVTGEKIPCSLLAVAIGVRPRIELARDLGLRIDNGILVNEHLQTSEPDIFAAGDVAQVYDPRIGRALVDSLWSSALMQGKAAGANMTGAAIPYVKTITLNVTRLAGITTTIIGSVGHGQDADVITIARGDSQAWRISQNALEFTDPEKATLNRVRLLVGERTIVGAVVMGDQTLSRALQSLIVQQTDISPIRAGLQEHPHAFADLIQQTYRQTESAQ